MPQFLIWVFSLLNFTCDQFYMQAPRLKVAYHWKTTTTMKHTGSYLNTAMLNTFTIWKTFCLAYITCITGTPQKPRWDRRGRFIQVVGFSDFHVFLSNIKASTNCQCYLQLCEIPPSGNSQPSQSKPKQDSSDSWRQVCKLNIKMNLIFYKILSFLTVSTMYYLDSLYFKITKTA